MNKLLSILTTLTVLLLLTGCWSKKELNELAVATALGIDKQGDQYHFSVQIINPDSGAPGKLSSSSSPIFTYSLQANSTFEAYRKVTTAAPRRIYMSHLRIVVIGEELAKEGISHVMDFLSRDHQMRSDFYILISKEMPAEQILRTITLLEQLPSNKLFDSLEASSSVWGSTVKATLDHFLIEITTEGKSAILSAVTSTGNQKSGDTIENKNKVANNEILEFVGTGVFIKDKLAGWLTQEESKIYNFITGGIKSTIDVIELPEQKGNIALEVIKATSKSKGHFVENKPVIDLKVLVEANIGESLSNIDLTKNHTLKDLEKLEEQKLTNEINILIEKAQQNLHSDFFGFGRTLHRDAPEEWRQWKENWNERFANLTVNVQVQVKVKGSGTVTNSYEVSE